MIFLTKTEQIKCPLCECYTATEEWPPKEWKRIKAKIEEANQIAAGMEILLIKELECQRCGHKWLPRKNEVYACAKCNSPKWNIPKPKEASK